MFLYRCRSTTDTLLHWQEIDILTDVWVYDIDSREKLETIITEIFSYISKYKIDIPEESCLVLEFRNSGRCGYYFVNHEEHRLFWLDVYNGPGTMDSLFNLKVKVEYTPSLIGKSFDARKNYFIDIEIRIGHEMKSLYWFVQRFNLCYMILFFFYLARLYRQASQPFISKYTSASIWGDSRNTRRSYPRDRRYVLVTSFLIYFIVLNWATTESLTSDEGLVSYKSDVLKVMLDLVNQIQGKIMPSSWVFL